MRGDPAQGPCSSGELGCGQHGAGYPKSAKGLYFGATATLLAWLIVLPLAGAGLFGLHLSAVQPLVSLLQHLAYGLVLAVTYDRLANHGPAAPAGPR